MPQREEQSTAGSRKRDGYWDLTKTLLIFLVVLGHCIQFLQLPGNVHAGPFWESPFFKGIYLFHMPLFMGISGYFAAASIRKHGRAILLRYGCRLGLPCVTYALIHMGTEWIRHIPVMHPCEELSILWFLVVVLESTCLYYLCHRYTHLFSRAALFILPILIVTACDLSYPRAFPAADQFTFLWPFFLTGAIMNEKGITSASIPKWTAALCLLFIPCSLYLPKQIFVYINPLEFSVSGISYAAARTVVAFFLCGGVLGVVQYLRCIEHQTLIQRIARATLALYVLQPFFFNALKSVLPGGISGLSDLAVTVISAFILLLLYGIYTLLRRIPLIPLLLFGEHQ